VSIFLAQRDAFLRVMLPTPKQSTDNPYQAMTHPYGQVCSRRTL